jgi:trimeric autotransporter adhesin
MKKVQSWPQQLVVLVCLFGTCLAEAGIPPGTVVAWGSNGSGQTNVPSGQTNAVALAGGGYHSLALQSNGTVVAWGDNVHGEAAVPSGLSNVITVAAGQWHSLALQSSGTVVAWGNNEFGQTTVPSGLNNVAAISGGYYHSLALQKNGTVVGWGYNADGETTIPTGMSNVVAIGAGYAHNLVLQGNGTVVAWGANYYGGATVPPGLSNVRAIAAGGWHSLALQSNGTVVAWGNNDHGQTTVPLGLTNVAAIAGGGYHSLALQSNGMVVAWGDNSAGEAAVSPGLSNVVAIAAGGQHSLAITPGPAFLAAPPPSISLVAGASTNLSVTVWPGSPFNYQWSFNGQPITGATNASLVVSNFSLAKAGAYVIAVSNQYVQATALAVLRLTNSPVILVDGVDAGGGTVDRVDSSRVTMSSLFGPNAGIYYTLDGSKPDFTALPYSGAFTLSNSTTIRAVAYNLAYTDSTEAAPISIRIWPAYPLTNIITGGGSVSISPVPYGAGNLYVSNTLVTLTATPSNGWRFIGWTGDSTATTNLTTVLMDRPRTVQALFEMWTIYPLSASTPGGGSVSVSPAPYAPENLYTSNTLVTVTATPSNGWSFVRWAGDSTATTNVTTVLMDQPRAVQALFGTSLTLFTNGNGQVLLDPPTGPYLLGSTVQLTALPPPGSYFFGWSGAASGFVNPLLFTINNPSEITALFGVLRPNQVLLTVLANPNGTVTIDPLKNVYTIGETVTLTAVPATGYVLTGWGGDASGNVNPLVLSLDTTKHITASFAVQPVFQTVVQTGGTLTFTWSAVAGRTYQVQYTTNLSQTDWSNLGSATLATNGTMAASDAVAPDSSQRWYRIALLP